MANTLSSTRRLRLGGCAGLPLLLAVPALALAQGSMSQDEARKRLESDKAKLEATQRRSKDLQGELDKIAAERERINSRLLDTARLVQQSEAQLSLIESRLGELDAQDKRLRDTLEARHGSMAVLLGAMLRMGRNPPPVMVASRKDMLSAFRSGSLLTPALDELGAEARALSAQLADIVRVRNSIRTEGEKLRAETTRLNDARMRLASLQESKRQSLSERQGELDKVRQVASDITRSVSDLGELIRKLDKEVADRTGLGTYEQEVPAAPAAEASPPGVAVAVATKDGKDGKAGAGQPADARNPAAVVLAPAGDRLAMLPPGRLKPAIAFQDAKGLLPLPAHGRRILSFNEKTQYGSQSKGMVLETRAGGQVVSPCDGWIVYSGEFRSYGQLLIINAGGGYHILLAGLSQIDAQLGQFVLAGEPVGVMTAGAKATPAKPQETAPILYIEFRKDQKPIDPDAWWSEATRKMMQG